MAISLWSMICRCSFGSAYRARGKSRCEMPNASIVPTDSATASADAANMSALDLQKIGKEQPPLSPREVGVIAFVTDAHLPLMGTPLRKGEVYALPSSAAKTQGEPELELVTLVLHVNGFAVERSAPFSDVSVSWTPFGLVQACRFHSAVYDTEVPWLRLFKITVFHHGKTHFFATYGIEADLERARWVADIARAMRVLTQSLFPGFALATQPVLGATWTNGRLLAGYMLLCDSQDISLVYCELRSHFDSSAGFVMYEDHYCLARVLHIDVTVATCINERVGVDCSCFSIDGYHFSVRTSAEKVLWLRAINNIKVKLRYGAANPSPSDLAAYRAAISECTKNLRQQGKKRSELLPRRKIAHNEIFSSVRADTDSTDEGSCQKVSTARVIVKSSSPRRIMGPAGSQSEPTPVPSLKSSNNQDSIAAETSRAPVVSPPVPECASKPRAGTPRNNFSSRSPRSQYDSANGDAPAEASRNPSETSSTTVPSGLVGGMASVATLSEMQSATSSGPASGANTNVQGTPRDPMNSKFSL